MNAILDTISKSVKITDYLALKGMQWQSHDAERYKYRCPLPTHANDNTPSFFVFDKPHGQDYYCFGCKSAGNIIQLVSAYEQITLRESIEKLSSGLNISLDDIVDSIVRELVIYSESGGKTDKAESIIAADLFVSNHMYNFLSKVDFNSEDLEIAEKVYKLVDSYILVERIDDLEKLVKALPARTKSRYERYMEEKKQEKIEKLRGQKNNEI